MRVSLRTFLDERSRMTVPGRAVYSPCIPSGMEEIPKSPITESAEAKPCPALDAVKRISESDEQPPYFPQPGDDLPTKAEGPMGPIGPWATGRMSFRPTAGITGIRPVVDRYSVTRFSPAEWRAHNKTFFDQSNEKIHEARQSTVNAKECMERVHKETDKNQLENRDRLSTRSGVVYQWKTELERGIHEMREEIELLEKERRRLKQSLVVLTIPESIAGEFLQLRSTRLEPDLVRDQVEEELIKEVALCSEIRILLIRTREQIEEQAVELKAAKNRMEFDWTDKKDAYEVDTACIGLTNDSPLILWKPGATRVPSEQSTASGYEQFTREALAAGQTARQTSVNLRSTLDSILSNSIRDLREQANRVDIALAEKISLTEQVCQHLEKELLKCLHELASIEDLIENLRASTQKLDYGMKVAQTRLDYRLLRRNVESCRDEPQYGLIEEVKTLGDNVSAMQAQLRRAEDAQAGLVKARSDLEREIVVKRKSLYIDRERGQWLRSFYPSAAALSGYQN
ncbi:tektin-4 isoform X2 [Cephus cinctus]|uniref:Tektin n=1 Tax=Cephus cinctus TaxID=211228 RepID=A0AAJ7RCH1_CEPCN|nr:tektin-4 isoform X2 [Cephus cinctus]